MNTERNTELNNYAKQFWTNFKNNYNTIYQLVMVGLNNHLDKKDEYDKLGEYDTLDKKDTPDKSENLDEIKGNAMDGLRLLNEMLPIEIRNNIEIEITFGEINRNQLVISKNLLEIYISPRYNNDNIKLMEELYKTQLPLYNLKVAKYKAYKQVSNEIPQELKFMNEIGEEFTIKYEDFGYQGSYSYKDGKPLLNLLIVINKQVSDMFLVKKKIQFENNNSRDVYMQNKIFPVDIYLNHIIGEYIMLNFVGYIELLPSDEVDETVLTQGLTELLDIKKNINLVLKAHGSKCCSYCDHHKLQVDLSICSRCKKAYYCSRICQKADNKRHKLHCVKVMS